MMSSILFPFGLCPMCNTPLRLNPKNDQVECSSASCDFSREYTAQDRQSVDEQALNWMDVHMKWDSYYRALEKFQKDFDEANGLNDKTKIKNIFQP